MLLLIVIMIAALIVAYLAVTQMGSQGIGKKRMEEPQIEQQDPVNAAQDVVDAINERMQQDPVNAAQDVEDAINQRQQEALEGLGLEDP